MVMRARDEREGGGLVRARVHECRRVQPTTKAGRHERNKLSRFPAKPVIASRSRVASCCSSGHCSSARSAGVKHIKLVTSSGCVRVRVCCVRVGCVKLTGTSSSPILIVRVRAHTFLPFCLSRSQTQIHTHAHLRQQLHVHRPHAGAALLEPQQPRDQAHKPVSFA